MENEHLVLITKFCLHHDVEPSFISSLHQFGLINVKQQGEKLYLYIEEISEVEKMVRLHHELGINLEGIDVINNLLKQIIELQHELQQARNRLNTFAPDDER